MLTRGDSDRPPSLVLLRGPSCSGKTTTALAVRRAVGRGVAVVQQDVVRRELLRERDLPGALNIDLIAMIVTRCLAGGYDVLLEGILDASRYGTMLRSLIAAHPGPRLLLPAPVRGDGAPARDKAERRGLWRT